MHQNVINHFTRLSLAVLLSTVSAASAVSSLRVYSLELSGSLQSKNVTAIVKVVDEQGGAVRSAVIHGVWTLPDGSTKDQYAVTGTRLRGEFPLYITQGGKYVFTVAGITKDGYTFDPGGSAVLKRKITIAGAVNNDVPVSWLEGLGYTNNFEAAALDDPDRDGFLNWQEYHAGTAADNRADFPKIGMASNQLHFASSTYCTYTIEWCDNLMSNQWNTFAVVPGTGSEIAVPATNGVDADWYYRLKIGRNAP